MIFINDGIAATTEDDISACEKLSIKDNEIAAFKIAVAEEILEKIYDEDLWPHNAIIRPYKNFWEIALTVVALP